MNEQSLQSYFDAEMRKLSQLSHEPIENHQVDRLLEGVAYLTAQIHQRIDDDFPEIPAQLLQQHWPHLIQRYPSGVILEFSSPNYINIPKNTLVASQPVGEEKTICKFATQYDLEIYPVSLIKIAIDNTAIKFYFESKQPDITLKKIKLFLNTDFNTALEIYYAVGQNNLLNNLDIFCGSQLWLDYFGFPEKFLFLELDIDHKANKYFEAKLVFKNKIHASITELDLKPEDFKLNCIPAVNLYHLHSEPIIYKNSQWEYDLIPDNNHKDSVLLQNIMAVTAVNHDFMNNYNINYQWQFARSKLIFFNKNLEDNTVLSAEIRVTNGQYPAHYIRENMVNKPINLYSGITAKNITRPTQSLTNPLEKYYFWNSLNQININLDKLELKDILNLYNWTAKKSYKKQLDNIISVVKKPVQKIIKNSFCQGLIFEISLKEEGFKNISEIYFFGCILYKYLILKSEVNYFIKLDIKLIGTGKILIWE